MTDAAERLYLAHDLRHGRNLTARVPRVRRLKTVVDAANR